MTESNGSDVVRRSSGPSLPRDAEVDQLLHPSRFYERPADVVTDALLTVQERRAILSSWASDACAVVSNPCLRKPPSAKAPITFDEIMDALAQLDRLERSPSRTGGTHWPPRRRAGARAGAA
jgi:hypothetical protein